MWGGGGGGAAFCQPLPECPYILPAHLLSMIEIIVAILFAVVMAAVIYFLLKKAVFLLINAIVGLVALFVINLLGVMSWFGAPEIPITAGTVLVCAFGGLPGALLLVALALAGITI